MSIIQTSPQSPPSILNKDSRYFHETGRPRSPDSAFERRRYWLGLALVAVVGSALFFTNLYYPLFEPDEGRHAEIAREMIESGDWIVPTLHHEPYFNKPILLYWLLAPVVSVFGRHAWAVRLVPAMCGLLTVIATYCFTRRVLGQRSAVWAGLLLPTTIGFFLCARFLVVDGLLTVLVTAALYSGYLAIEEERLRWGWWLGSAALLGLGVLAKGPVAGVIVFPVLVAWSYVSPRAARLRLGSIVVFAAVTAVVCLPWYVAILVREPDFFKQFVIDHHFGRFLGGKGHHEEPWWYYAVVLVAGLCPWPVVFALSVWRGVKRVGEPFFSRPEAFVLIWIGWTVLFFSLSKGKLPTYILPIAPAAAVLMGAFVAAATRGGRAETGVVGWGRRVLPLLFLSMVATVWIVLTVVALSMRLLPHEPAHYLVAGLCAVIVPISFLAARRWQPWTLWAQAVGLTAVLLLQVGSVVVPDKFYQIYPIYRREPLASAIRDGDVPVVFLAHINSALAFYIDRPDMLCYGHKTSRANIQRFIAAYDKVVLDVGRVAGPHDIAAVVPAGYSVKKVCRNRGFDTYLVYSGDRHPEDEASGAVNHYARGR